MILETLYLLIGLVLAVAAVRIGRDRAHPRRIGSAAFWGLLAAAFLVGDRVPPEAVGAGVLALALLAGTGAVGRAPATAGDAAGRAASAARLGNRLFAPALAIPLLTVLGVFLAKLLVVDGRPLLPAQHQTLGALGLACVIALAYACTVTRRGPGEALDAARGLLDAIGWAAVLPIALATLGAVFAAAGVGELVARGVAAVIPTDSRLACVLAYGLGMALFTMIMGNAFAAFPVLTAGVGLPLLVQGHGADPASLAAIGMLCGYCGTLMTPMAANFNVVPAALLELRDPHAVIRAQVPTALPLLAANLVLMYVLVFR